MERELFDLDILVGNWESINLNPTVMIHAGTIVFAVGKDT